MRLWHYELIPYLPKQQLLGQWRELNSIYVKEDKHILINYVYEYHEDHLYVYSLHVIKEMMKRKYKIHQWQNFYRYFKMPMKYSISQLTENMQDKIKPFPEHHNETYKKICCWNLFEKHLRGQAGFTEEAVSFIKSVIYSDVEDLKTQLEDLKIKLETWYQLLSCSGINSKHLVKAEIKKVLEEKQNVK